MISTKTETYLHGIRKNGETYERSYEACYSIRTKSERIAKEHDNFCVDCGTYKNKTIGKYIVIKTNISLLTIKLYEKKKSIIFTCIDCLNVETNL